MKLASAGWPAMALGLAVFAEGAEKAAKVGCEFQDSTCQESPGVWPVSSFRLGGVVLGDVNGGSIWNLAYPHRREALGVAANLSAAFGMEISSNVPCLLPPLFRFAFIFAPATIEWRTDWPTGKREGRTTFHGAALISAQYRGFSLNLGMSEYKLGDGFGKAMGNWNNTSIGVGMVLCRFPDWGGRNFVPELRQMLAPK